MTQHTHHIYYRRVDEFPAHHPDDIEISGTPHPIGTGDTDWRKVRSDDGLAEDLRIAGSQRYHECVLLADALVIYRALLGSGLVDDHWTPGSWTLYTYDELEASDPEDYAYLCDALQLFSREDAIAQARTLVRTCSDDTHGHDVREALSDRIKP